MMSRAVHRLANDNLAASRTVDHFAELYEREFAGQVRRAALLLADHHGARDVVHDAFTSVFQQWSRINDPVPYLHRAVTNRCRDLARSAGRRSRFELPDNASSETPDEVWDALRTLPFNQRAAVVLRHYYQMTDREIAETIGCRVGSVGPWLNRGLNKLRTELE